MRAEDSKRQCVKCKHRFDYSACKAFPNQIPLILLSGRAEHDELVEGQEGDFIFEPHDRFKHQYDEPRKINEEKQIRILYRTNKEKLPRLVIEEITKRGYNIENIDVVTYQAKKPFDGFYSAEINLFPNAETISLGVVNKLSSEYEIFSTFLIINYTERIYDNSKESLHLKIYDIENYQYLDDLDSVISEEE